MTNQGSWDIAPATFFREAMTKIDWWAGAQFLGGQMSDYRERACTCHPSEAPRPCPQRYAYSECVLAAEIERLRAALKPFADAVYNDNGDMTVTPCSHNAYAKAYFVMRPQERPDKSTNEIARSPQWKRWTDYLARKHPTGGG